MSVYISTYVYPHLSILIRIVYLPAFQSSRHMPWGWRMGRWFSCLRHQDPSQGPERSHWHWFPRYGPWLNRTCTRKYPTNRLHYSKRDQTSVSAVNWYLIQWNSMYAFKIVIPIYSRLVTLFNVECQQWQ